MKALFYDSETSGLPLWNEPSEDPRQPHIVQLAAILVDLETRKRLASIDLTICPQGGWKIPDDVAKIHGITTEIAESYGVPELDAIQLFGKLWQRADIRIGHNESFDARIVRIALVRNHHEFTVIDPELWKRGRAECTQLLATPIMKLPPTAKMLSAGFNKPKSANLREAHKHFIGEELVDAHSAMADAVACMEVYYAIKDRGAAAA